jgi:hypothetical protein
MVTQGKQLSPPRQSSAELPTSLNYALRVRHDHFEARIRRSGGLSLIRCHQPANAQFPHHSKMKPIPFCPTSSD